MAAAQLTAAILSCVLSVSVIEDAPGDKLVFSYSFHNGSDRVAYLFNRLYDQSGGDGRPLLVPTIVDVTRDGDKVLIAKTLANVPPGMSVLRHVIPCLTRVDPGDTYEEVVVVPEPAVRHFPYNAMPPRGDEHTLPADFALGFFLAYPGREDTVPQVETATGPAYCIDAFSKENQSILRVGPVSNAFHFVD